MSSNRSYHTNHNHIDIDCHKSKCIYRLKCLPIESNKNSKSFNRFNGFNVLTKLNIIFIFIALILVTSIESIQIQIPDQQTTVGKLFHYKIQLSSSHDLKYINITKADDGFKLPDWLYFNRETLELIGIPFEKGLFFIQIEIKYYGKQQWNDIFAIEVNDGPQPTTNQLVTYRCILRIKQTFKAISDVWRVISSLLPQNSISNRNSQTFSDWLQRFSISRNTNGEYLISYDIESCDTNHLSEEHDSSYGIRTKLNNLGFDSDVVQITRKQLDENQFYNDMIAATHPHTYDEDSVKRNSHYRRNVANAIQPTPILAPDWMTLTTQTIIPSTDVTEPSEHDLLSRVLIPSMISPTISMSSTPTSIPIADPIENSILGGHEHRHNHIHGNKYETPYINAIYTTPVMASERPTFTINEDVFTPSPVTPTLVLQTSQLISDSILIAPSPSAVPEITTSQTESTTEKPTTSAPEIPSIGSSIPNKTPYINKRIRKLELISGKYWKYTIPSDVFVDFEDGDTRKLKLTFLMSTSGTTQEQPTSDYWIQFDHENQYLYALPTDEDIGKHFFKLVAVDSSGAPVTETLEVHVRQHKNTRAFTHIFTLSNVFWNPFQFACLIEATASLLTRVATRVFTDSDIHYIAVQKIIKNEKENSWTISWTNDSIPTHPCPREQIQELYSKLHDSDKVYEDSSAEPSRLLRQNIGPEFRVQKVQLNFITKSACGSYEIPDPDDRRPKEYPIIRNRIGKLGPFKLGEAFKYRIPEDTVFSPARHVGTRELSLSLQSIEPPEMPEFLYFDREEQEIFGLTLNKERVKSYELNLVAEDLISGGTVSDIFTIDIIQETVDQTKQPTFEVVINLLGPPGRDDLTIREKVDIIQRISSGMFSDGDASALHILSIEKFEYDRLGQGFGDDNNYLDSEPIEDNEENGHRRNHRHKHQDTAPKHRHSRDTNSQHYFEFKWTNRSIVGHEICPKDSIFENIYKRMFERDYDSLQELKQVFLPNYDLINVEFEPIGVCKNKMNSKVMGPRPIPLTSPTTTYALPTTTTPVVIDNNIDESNEFLLTTIIPPVAILIALIFAAIVGCCFHRANKRRKSVEISTRLPGETGLNEREAFLQKGRIPIIFEFEQQSPQQPQQFNYSTHGNSPTPVIPPPQQVPQQQMTPLRQLSSSTKPTYQALPQSGSRDQKRQPPPYYK